MVKLLREEGEPRKIHRRIRSFDGGLIRIRYQSWFASKHNGRRKKGATKIQCQSRFASKHNGGRKKGATKIHLRTSLKGIVVEIFGEK